MTTRSLLDKPRNPPSFQLLPLPLPFPEPAVDLRSDMDTYLPPLPRRLPLIISSATRSVANHRLLTLLLSQLMSRGSILSMLTSSSLLLLYRLSHTRIYLFDRGISWSGGRGWRI